MCKEYMEIIILINVFVAERCRDIKINICFARVFLISQGNSLFLSSILLKIFSLFMLLFMCFTNSIVVVLILDEGRLKPSPNCKRLWILRGMLVLDKFINQLFFKSEIS